MPAENDLVVITDLYRNQGGCWFCGGRNQDITSGKLIVFDGTPIGTYQRGRRRTVPTAGLLHERCARTVLHCLDQARRYLDIIATTETALT